MSVDERRGKRSSHLFFRRIFNQQQDKPETQWRVGVGVRLKVRSETCPPPQLPNDFEPVYETVQGEVVVGGVFLRLLIKQPNWSFRMPR